MKRRRESASAKPPLDAAPPAEAEPAAQEFSEPAAPAEESPAASDSGEREDSPAASPVGAEAALWLEGAAAAAPASGDGLAAAVRLIRLEEGLYTIGLGPLAGPAEARDGMSLPAAHFSFPPPFARGPAAIIAGSGDEGPWLGAEGGTLVVRAPSGGAAVLVTLYGAEAPAAVEIGVEPLLPPAPRPAAAA
ncbi:MAG TPA: hypothetical protein VM755_00885, partial [Stellaceae bacterium]|nr:hypothetical protein [Stellaceae bacterium]